MQGSLQLHLFLAKLFVRSRKTKNLSGTRTAFSSFILCDARGGYRSLNLLFNSKSAAPRRL